jgi:NAD(P)H-hydrate epimerase
MPVAWADSGPYVIAVDCPSGLDCDTGEVGDLTLPADETVTFGAVKRGQVLFPGAGLGGALHVADIGLPKKLPARDAIKLEMPTGADIRALLPPLPPDAHKGTFGKVLVVVVDELYGAAALAAEAAYRAGAGLVTVATPQPIMPSSRRRFPKPPGFFCRTTWV